MDTGKMAKEGKSGILKCDKLKSQRSGSASSENKDAQELLAKSAEQRGPVSPQPSVDRLSVTWAEPELSVSSASTRVNLFHMGADPPLDMDAHLPATPVLAGEGSEDEDYSASMNAFMYRRESTRRSRKGRARRPSSPFLADADPHPALRRCSMITNSSGDTVASMEEGQPAAAQEQLVENIRLHKEFISEVKQERLAMRKKLKLVHQAKTYIKRHEGQLQERLAQSKNTRDMVAKCNILLAAKWQHLKREAANMSNVMIPWELRIKEIESHFGSVVASYFTFLRWLFWVNLVISVLLVVFVIVPEMLRADVLLAGERKVIYDEDKNSSTNLLSLWEFEGVLKCSPIFYGYYTNVDYGDYRLPFAYFMTGLAVYVYSFVATLRKMAENSRMSKLSEKEDECIFSWKLFTGWDFMIGNTETAHNRTASIILGFKEALLEEEEKKKDPRNWRIISLRVLVNLCVGILLVVSAFAVVKVVEGSNEVSSHWWIQNEITIVMSLISNMFPIIFEILGMLEHYHPRKQLRIQLGRIMVLNLLNIYSLIFALFSKIDGMTTQLESLKPKENSTYLNGTYLHFMDMSNSFVSLYENDTHACYGLATKCKSCEINIKSLTTEHSITEPEGLYASPAAMRIMPTFSDSINNSTLSIQTTQSFYNNPDNGKNKASIALNNDPFNTIAKSKGYLDTKSFAEPNLLKKSFVNNSHETTTEIFYTDSISLAPTKSEEIKKYIQYISNFARKVNDSESDENVESDDYEDYITVDASASTEFGSISISKKLVPNNTNESIFDQNATEQINESSSENDLNTDMIKETFIFSIINDTDTSGQSDLINEPTSGINNDTWNFIPSDVNDTDVNITNYLVGPSLPPENDGIDVNPINVTETLSTYSSINLQPYSMDYIEKDNDINVITTNTTMIMSMPNNTETNFNQSDEIYNSPDDKFTTQNPPISNAQNNTTNSNRIIKTSATNKYSSKIGIVDAFNKSTIGATTPTITEGRITKSLDVEINKTSPCYEMKCIVKTSYYRQNNASSPRSLSSSRDVIIDKSHNHIRYNLSMDTKRQLKTLCWETMFGQELVKLTMMDLVLSILGTLLMDFFRAVFVRYMNRCWCWNLEKKFPLYGDFKIAENILHLVNNQGMVWMGLFFSPGLAVLNLVKLVILMYLRSWAVMTCNVPHEIVFRASRSNNFYLGLLLIMLFLCVLPVGYAIVWVRPSWHCGPFSDYERIYYIFTSNLNNILPDKVKKISDYIASPGIVIPLLVLLILVIYYLMSLTNSLREANNDLKTQLRRERTEERRKMFQLADRRRRVGSAEMENTPFSRWKKILPILPPGKSIDSDERRESNDGDTKIIRKKKGDIFAKIVNMALRRPVAEEKNQEIMKVKIPAFDEETDTEFHEALPVDVLKSKNIELISKAELVKRRPNVEFVTTDDGKIKEEIASPTLKFKKETASTSIKFPDKPQLKLKTKEVVMAKVIADLKLRKKNDKYNENNLRKSDNKEDVGVHAPMKTNFKQQSVTSSHSKQSDSIGSVIPVITISKTESDDDMLRDSSPNTATAEEVLTRKNIPLSDETSLVDRSDTPILLKRGLSNLKALKRQSSVDSINEHSKGSKEKKYDEGHKFQYSL